MLYKNPDLDRALSFIKEADFDVFCLQEVPEQFLPQLESLPFYYDRAIEMTHTEKTQASTRNLVILSRYPITHTTHIPLPYREVMLKWRSWIFLKVMVALNLWGLGTGNRHTQYVDVDTGHGSVRVFNIHLPLATPEWRIEEFEWALEHKQPDMPTIICGDFNILEHPSITPLTWLLGGKLSDVFWYKRERTLIEQRFIEHRLTNAHRGQRTHAISRSQLDHILVSHHFSITRAKVVKDAHGSDHQPIVAEIKR